MEEDLNEWYKTLDNNAKRQKDNLFRQYVEKFFPSNQSEIRQISQLKKPLNITRVPTYLQRCSRFSCKKYSTNINPNSEINAVGEFMPLTRYSKRSFKAAYVNASQLQAKKSQSKSGITCAPANVVGSTKDNVWSISKSLVTRFNEAVAATNRKSGHVFYRGTAKSAKQLRRCLTETRKSQVTSRWESLKNSPSIIAKKRGTLPPKQESPGETLEQKQDIEEGRKISLNLQKMLMRRDPKLKFVTLRLENRSEFATKEDAKKKKNSKRSFSKKMLGFKGDRPSNVEIFDEDYSHLQETIAEKYGEVGTSRIVRNKSTGENVLPVTIRIPSVNKLGADHRSYRKKDFEEEFFGDGDS